jgi:hypothetical protein
MMAGKNGCERSPGRNRAEKSMRDGGHKFSALLKDRSSTHKERIILPRHTPRTERKQGGHTTWEWRESEKTPVKKSATWVQSARKDNCSGDPGPEN